MTWITVNADIDIDDFLSSCHRNDIKYLIECLVEDGHLEESVINKNKNHNTVLDFDWEEKIEKLKSSRHHLSIEEENLIIKISDRLV
jgi:hypothetical protein